MVGDIALSLLIGFTRRPRLSSIFLGLRIISISRTTGNRGQYPAMNSLGDPAMNSLQISSVGRYSRARDPKWRHPIGRTRGILEILSPSGSFL